MAVALEARMRVQDFISAEIRYLDDRDWDKWLSLFDEGVEKPRRFTEPTITILSKMEASSVSGPRKSL
ncbi:hypothetical protein [Pseudoxanthomonas spadix]|uniref:hypothetical protein n=1 Tax=Pseudoxanthomonas spadix TaxID=415229 RepID=UPI0011D28EA3|nr:hypothetical protein [Pseudoxanthomonas spadix]